MNTTTYLFYDIETTGLNKCFDQVLQFAAIRTDEHFNEIERHNFLVKLNPDIVPSPHAMITHRISLDDCAKGMSEYDAIQKIHALLNTPNTISLGYNSLNFDDEFLRFSFYRNLLPPYTHQFANGCARMDIYPIVVMYFLFKPDVLKWLYIDDKPSLKLEAINAENDFVKGQAHDALVDVEATVALAKALRQEEEMWGYVTGYFNKQTDIERIKACPELFEGYRHGVMVSGKMGARNLFHRPVLCLGQHKQYANQTLWLALDRPELQEVTEENVEDASWAIHKKYAEPGFVLPPAERFLSKLASERLGVVEENKKWLREHPEVLRVMADYHCEYTYPEVPNLDIEAALYQNGFLSQAEQFQCVQFHNASPSEKAKLIEQFSPQLYELALRILGRHFPEVMSEKQRSHFDDFLAWRDEMSPENIPVDYKGEPRFTLQHAREAVANLQKDKTLDEEQKALLLSFNNAISKPMFF